MSDVYQSLAHSKWDCKYHVVFVPKRRRKAIFGNIRRQLGPIFHALAKQKECQIVEGHLMSDHVHMCIAIPPKHPVASVIGFLKGKSAIAIARLSGKERNFSGEHFWARGYAVSTVGFELEQVRQYGAEREFDRSAILGCFLDRADGDEFNVSHGDPLRLQ
jgi:putative transposase